MWTAPYLFSTLLNAMQLFSSQLLYQLNSFWVEQNILFSFTSSRCHFCPGTGNAFLPIIGQMLNCEPSTKLWATSSTKVEIGNSPHYVITNLISKSPVLIYIKRGCVCVHASLCPPFSTKVFYCSPIGLEFKGL